MEDLKRREFLKKAALGTGAGLGTLVVGKPIIEHYAKRNVEDEMNPKLRKQLDHASSPDVQSTPAPTEAELKAQELAAEKEAARTRLLEIEQVLLDKAVSEDDKKEVVKFATQIRDLVSSNDMSEKLVKVSKKPTVALVSDESSDYDVQIEKMIQTVFPPEILISLSRIIVDTDKQGATVDIPNRSIIIGNDPDEGTNDQVRYLLRALSEELANLNGPENNLVLTFSERVQLVDMLMKLGNSPRQTVNQEKKSAGQVNIVRETRQSSNEAENHPRPNPAEALRLKWKRLFSDFLLGNRLTRDETEVINFVMRSMMKQTVEAVMSHKNPGSVSRELGERLRVIANARTDMLRKWDQGLELVPPTDDGSNDWRQGRYVP